MEFKQLTQRKKHKCGRLCENMDGVQKIMLYGCYARSFFLLFTAQIPFIALPESVGIKMKQNTYTIQFGKYFVGFFFM